MTTLSNLTTTGQDSVPFPASAVISAGTDADNSHPAGDEAACIFANVLESCTEPEMIARDLVADRRNKVSGPASGEGQVIERDAPSFATTARSLLGEPALASAEEGALAEAPSALGAEFTETKDAPPEVPLEIMSLSASLAVPLIAPPPVMAAGHHQATAAGTGKKEDVVDKKLHVTPMPAPAVPTPSAPAVPTPSAPAPLIRDGLPATQAVPAALGHDQPALPYARAEDKNTAITVARFVPVAEKAPLAIESGIPLEKIAAPAFQAVDRPVKSVANNGDFKFLKPDDQSDALPQKERGTVNAKSSVDMHATPESIPAQPPVVHSRMGGLTPDTVPVVTPVPVSPAFTTTPATTAEIVEKREISLPVTDATSVVREVAELTHDFRLRERSSVEVKFNFKDDTELSVRLAYRDGDVHTTFRTDSDDLRVALSREWQGYAANFAQEPRGYRVADPVFTSSNNFSDSAQGRDSGSSAGGDARNRQQASQSGQPDASQSGSHAREFRPHAPVLGPRVSSDRLLHAFA